MFATLQTLLTMTEWPVWLLLGSESVTVLAVALSALTAHWKTRRNRTKYYGEFYHRFAARAGTLGAAGRHSVAALLAVLPDDTIGAFVRWRAARLDAVDPAAVEQQIAFLMARAEGASSRLLDFCKLSAPLLGLSGTLMGLRVAFSQASHGQAAVQAGIATALGTTLAGIAVAIGTCAVLKLALEPGLAALEHSLWEAEQHLREGATMLRGCSLEEANGKESVNPQKEKAYAPSYAPALPDRPGVAPY